MAIDFQYTLIRRPYRRSLTLSISPENQVRVLAPVFLSEKKIREFMHRKSSWIFKQFEKNGRRPKPIPRRFEAGESFPFLGGEMVLEIQEGKSGVNVIPAKAGIGELEDPRFQPEADPPLAEKHSRMTLEGKIRVTIPANLEAEERRGHIAWRIEDWYRAEAVKIFRERVSHYQDCVGPQPRNIRVKEFRGQWGSASRRGILSFNWRLLLAPLEVVDYVVVHELAHLEHPNHSRRFWAKVGEIFPDYLSCRRWLRTHGRLLRLDYLLRQGNPSSQPAAFVLS